MDRCGILGTHGVAAMDEISFEATVRRNPDAGGGSYVEFPFDAEKSFGRGGRIKVVCYFDDVEYRGSLARMGTEGHIVGITKDILQRIGKKPGDTVAVRMWEDKGKREVEIDLALAKAFDGAADLKKAYDGLSFTKKKEINTSIGSAKRPETKIKRLNKTLDDLRKKTGKENGNG